MSFVHEMKLILLLLSLTISTLPTSASEKTREKVKYHKDRCIIGYIEDKKIRDKFIFVDELRTSCSCFANKIVQGLDTDECGGPKSVKKKDIFRYFSWD